jgi:NADPH:quinone reductase-like Zn-dependent oxidoreductase
MKAYEIQQFGIENLALVERAKPQVEPNQVLVKIRAASLNYRDLLMVTGRYNPRLKLPLVPLSDGAGEVAAVGDKVSQWKAGDRVCTTFFQGWTAGKIEFSKIKTALGGDLDGVLREFAAFDESGLIKIPEDFSFAEAATLPCAALTTWNALFETGNLQAGETVLIQGTGGVSVFALQFAKAVGARAIVTSSSEEKLEKARRMGADETINYKQTPDWDKEVLRLTEKRGVDCVVEVGGAGTLSKSLNAVKIGGYVALIGVLAGNAEVNWTNILMKAIRLNGIFVGSREMFERMNKFISEHQIKPVIDGKFSFDAAQSALKFMESGSHFGKIIIEY